MSKPELRRAQIVAAQDDELQLLAARAKGPLTGKRVLQFASNPKTALHRVFDWSDRVAGAKWRLHQAEMLLTTRMVIIESDRGPITVRAFLHLPSEGGYRTTDTVMRNDQMVAEVTGYYRQRLESLQRDARNIALLSKNTLYLKVQEALELQPVDG